MLFVSLLVSTGHYMLMSTLPLYAATTSGRGELAGLVVTVFTVSALLFRPVFGNLMDVRGRTPVLVLGAGILLTTALLYNFTTAVGLLLVIRFIQGAGFSAHTTSSGTIVADIVPKSRLSEGIGYFGIANTVATAIGPFLGLYCVKSFGYGTFFLWVSVLAVLSFLSTLCVNYEKKKPKGALESSSGRKDRRSFIEATSVRPSLVVFFVAMTFGAIITYLPAFGISRKIENIGVFFSVYAAAVLCSRMITGRIADRYGFTKVILPALISLGISLALLAFSHSFPMILAAGIFYGLGYGIAIPLLNAIVIQLCPEGRKGAATATIFAAMDIGIGFGALFWGWIERGSGFTAVYLLASLCSLVALLMYAVLVAKKVRSNAKPT